MDLKHYINELVEEFESSELFYGHGTDNALDEAIYLTYGVLDIGYKKDLEAANRELSNLEITLLDEKAQLRIKQRIPVAYLLNQAWFAGYRFYSDERALVPRSPIAELISNKFEPLLANEPQRILDLCCGSGCIGIACAKQFPGALIDLSDIDSSALELASNNIELQRCATRVNVIESDLFEDINDFYDLIVCNPPYVSQEDFDKLPKEYKAEPALGFVSEQEGTGVAVKILREVEKYLTPGGLLIMEVGCSANLLQRRNIKVPFLWLEFIAGGEGVLALTRDQLKEYSKEFN